MNGQEDPIVAALVAVEQEEAAKAAENVTKRVSEARGAIDMVTSLGADVKIVLQLTDRDEARNSFEFGPANARHKLYYKDLEDLKRQLKEAKEGREEAARQGLLEAAKPKNGGA